MKIFESFKDIDNCLPISTQLVAAKLLYGLIEACVDGNGGYEPEIDGRVVLIEETDSEEMIEEVLGGSIEDARSPAQHGQQHGQLRTVNLRGC